jgi:hypothetical protein
MSQLLFCQFSKIVPLNWHIRITLINDLKRTLDFRPQVFFLLTTLHGPLVHWLNPFCLRSRIHQDIQLWNRFFCGQGRVSMTELTSGGRCQWHRWPLGGSVNDTTDLWFCQCLGGFSFANFVPIRLWNRLFEQPLTNGRRCQWHRWQMVDGVNETPDTPDQEDP